jgi:hypothetical protein
LGGRVPTPPWGIFAGLHYKGDYFPKELVNANSKGVSCALSRKGSLLGDVAHHRCPEVLFQSKGGENSLYFGIVGAADGAPMVRSVDGAGGVAKIRAFSRVAIG